MKARISAIDYYLPEKVLTNEELSRLFPEWPVEKIMDKTGIERRHIAGPAECSSDLGENAARKLFASGAIAPDAVDFLLLCTQSPDYFLPTTACVLQARLGIPSSAGALDINLGCSGFVYGLGLAKGLIESGQAKNVLFITAETYSKYLEPTDKGVRTIFGDAGAAALISASRDETEGIFIPNYGSDGSGMENLIVSAGGMRHPLSDSATADSSPVLRMNGPEVFSFSLARVPPSIANALANSGLSMAEIDLFVFHQANSFMLSHLQKKCGIPGEKFFVSFSDIGNTVSCTIPIALKRAEASGALKKGMFVLLSGFGVGYSWASCVVRW